MNKQKKEPWLKKTFLLSDVGYQNLLKGISACILTSFSLMLPFGISVLIIMEAIKPLTGAAASPARLWILFGAGVIAAFLMFLCNKNDYKKTYVTAYQESENSRTAMAEHIRKLPMSVFNSKDLTELTLNLMDDVRVSEQVFSHIVPQIAANAVTIVVACGAMAFLDWRMSLAMFITVPVAFFVIWASRGIQNRLGKKQSAAKMAASAQVQEYIEGIKVIKACGLDGDKFSALDNALKSMRDLAIRFEIGVGVFITGAQVVLQAGIGIVIFYGTSLISGGEIEFIPLLMFLLAVTRIYGPFLTELTLLPELLYYQIAIGRMRKLMEIEIMEGDKKVKPPNFAISFDDVNFRYNKEGEAAIQNMRADFPADGITALVGPSGCGKSTVSKLIARFWDTDSGIITIGGIRVNSVDPEHLMSYMSFIFQDVVLFNDTVYNNIKIGDMDATYQQVMAAAKAACCNEFVSKLPDGYNTMLGENGSTLSGGERQRISIARALLKDAPIVLLDEATASLDPENESVIQQAIGRLISGKTVVVIAHRLRTVADADRIIVLDNGLVVEEGTHTELYSENRLYHRLYSIQEKSMGWSV